MAGSRPSALLPWVFAACSAACGGADLPDPELAARAYAEAAARGDAAALHAMLTRESQRAYGPEGTERLVRDSRGELSRQAKALAGPGVTIEATATVPLNDGSYAELELEGGGFRVASADTLPSGARTPNEALEDLRRALARRSYAALLRVLSRKARVALDGDLGSLEAGLADPATLDVRVSGDRAEVEVPGGHAVTLEREGGVWRVDDIE